MLQGVIHSGLKTWLAQFVEAPLQKELKASHGLLKTFAKQRIKTQEPCKLKQNL